MDAGLYVVATPIGNLGDISQRALDVLQGADLIAAEDTRHSARLLSAHGIETRLVAYHEHSGERAAEELLGRIEGGAAVALISDAGTPLISDPGYRLVRSAQERGLAVVPLPGACAAVAALSASGLATDRFLFEGFLPAKAGARQNRLRELVDTDCTLVFYEAPHRIQACLEDLVEVFGAGREAVLARELSKAFETVIRAPLAELSERVAGDENQRRGEIVLLLAGAGPRGTSIDDDVARWLRRLAEDMPAKAAAQIAADVTGLRKKSLYEFLVAEREGGDAT